jgi:acyl-CoA thioester hydrolase
MTGVSPPKAWGPFDVHLRWTDFDRYGHVNNAAYVTLLEIVRERFLLDRLGSVPHFVVARLEVDFQREIRDDVTGVDGFVRPERLGRSSVLLSESLVLPDGAVAAEARTTMVLWDEVTRSGRPLTVAERAALQPA